MDKIELRQMQLDYIRKQGKFEEAPFAATFSWADELEKYHNTSKRFTELITGHPLGRFDMLRALFFHGDHQMRPAKLAAVAGMTRASATHNIDVLEKKELIVRKSAIDDRRSVIIQLTEKGLEHIGKIMDRYLQAVSDIIIKNDLELTVNLTRRLKKRTASLERYLGTL